MKITLFKPFERFSTNGLLLAGVLATIVGSYLGYEFYARFNGVLDMHFTKDHSLNRSLLENVINVVCLIISLFVAAKIINPRTRLIDLVTTATVSRIPMYVLPLANASEFVQNAFNNLEESINLDNLSEISITQLPIATILVITVFSIVAILLLVWYVALIWNGFKTASNAKGSSHIISFIVALLVAEISSKILIFTLL